MIIEVYMRKGGAGNISKYCIILWKLESDSRGARFIYERG